MNGDRAPVDLSFSLARGGPLYFLLRRIGVIPAGGLGIRRRILLAWALTVVPVVVLAFAAGQLIPAAGFRDALLRHFSVFARLLVAIPIFIATEAIVERFVSCIGPQLRATGLLTEGEVPRFRDAVRLAERLRDSRAAFAALLAAAVLAATAAAAAFYDPTRLLELSWATVERGGRQTLGAAGYWYVIAGYGLYLLLGLQWIWRILVLLVLYRGIAGLDLSLVPTHPDRAGGLGFLQKTMLVLAPLGFAVSSVFSARWSHGILYSGLHVRMLESSMIAFIVIFVVLLACPVLVFAPVLLRLRRTSLLEYSPFISRHGRLVYNKWVRGEPVPDEESGVLAAPELGPLIDINNLYESVQDIRPVPLSPRAVIALVLVIGFPILPVLLLEVPLKEILGVFARSL